MLRPKIAALARGDALQADRGRVRGRGRGWAQMMSGGVATGRWAGRQRRRVDWIHTEVSVRAQLQRLSAPRSASEHQVAEPGLAMLKKKRSNKRSKKHSKERVKKTDLPRAGLQRTDASTSASEFRAADELRAPSASTFCDPAGRQCQGCSL